MSRSNVIVAAIAALFVLYIAARGDICAYVSMLYGGSSASADPGMGGLIPGSAVGGQGSSGSASLQNPFSPVGPSPIVQSGAQGPGFGGPTIPMPGGATIESIDLLPGQNPTGFYGSGSGPYIGSGAP